MLVPALRKLNLAKTKLVLQSRRFHRYDYGGYSSELFGVERQLLKLGLSQWTGRHSSTETFVLWLKELLTQIQPGSVAKLPRLALPVSTVRSGDRLVMTYL